MVPGNQIRRRHRRRIRAGDPCPGRAGRAAAVRRDRRLQSGWGGRRRPVPLSRASRRRLRRPPSMSVPLNQALRVGAYVVKQHLAGRKRYPLVLMLEPLFRCNLACAGCGKIDYPPEILNQRLSVAECLEAVDECGAPVVVIAGGEPLLHKELDKVVEGAIDRKKFVIVCTNALLLEKKLSQFKPNKFFSWSVHLDGNKDDHDKSVCQAGVYDRAVAAIRKVKAAG